MINVYLADDDLDDQEIFTLVLRAVKPESVVTVVNNGKELLSKLKENKALPDVIFLDINMPEVNGFEALQAIRADHHFSEIPVMVFTTSGESADIELMQKFGADYYITKPFGYGLLFSVLTKAVSKKTNGEFERSSGENFIIS